MGRGQKQGWSRDEVNPWTFARCLRLAWMRAKLEGQPSSTMQFFKPGEPLQIPEYMLPTWRAIIDMEDLTPERRDICLRALAALVINMHAVVYDGAEPKFGAVAK